MLTSLGPMSARASTEIHVPAEWPSIQSAIDAAQDGDTVLVASGTYNENINFHGKAITVRSESGPSSTIIDGQQIAPVARFVSNEPSSATLEGFTLRNGRPVPTYDGYSGGGVLIRDASPVISRNWIVDNIACGGQGLSVGGGSAVIRDNVIARNREAGCSGGDGGGISAGGIGSINILNNLIEDNLIPNGQGGGISVGGAGAHIIRNNVIRNNVGYINSALDLSNAHNPLVTQNLIYGNTSNNHDTWYKAAAIGISVGSGERGPYLINNSIMSPDATGVAVTGYFSSVVIANNIVTSANGYPPIDCVLVYSTEMPTIGHNLTHSPDGEARICGEPSENQGNSFGDPGFVDAEGNDFHLSDESIGIDAGNSAAPQKPRFDLDGRVRIAGPAIDVGVYERDGTPFTDDSPPVVASSVSPPPNAAGWSREAVAVSFNTSDPESGIDAANGCDSQNLYTETTGTTLTCVAVNGFDLSTSKSVIVRIDTTPPMIAFRDRTPANEDGWNNGDVDVTWTCTDPLSGTIASSVTATAMQEGRNQSVVGICTDRADNSRSMSQNGINIDRTAPTVTIDAGSMIAIAPSSGVLTGSASDSLSGVKRVTVTIENPITGAIITREASCTGCPGNQVTWSVSTGGLTPGVYRVTVIASDLAKNAEPKTSLLIG